MKWAVLVLAAVVGVMTQQEENTAKSPSEFPYHSFMCDDLELQEFIDEQEMCYHEKEEEFSSDNLVKSRARTLQDAGSQSSESLESESEEEPESESDSGSDESSSSMSWSWSYEDNSSEEEAPEALLATYDWHCKEIQAKISCITDNSHKCYNDTQVSNIVFNYLADHFYAFYQEASDGTRTLLPLCEPLLPYETMVVQILTGKSPDEKPCDFKKLSQLFKASSNCYEKAYDLMLNPGDFVSFFPNSKELRRVKRCRGKKMLVNDCQPVFEPCYAEGLMEEVRKSGEEELEGVEEIIKDFSGEDFKFSTACNSDAETE